ncbi:MAG: hypothetical protein NVSMB9_28760 [Isosphaeraceae bacterium]
MRPAVLLLGFGLFAFALSGSGCDGGGGDLKEGAVPSEAFNKPLPTMPGLPAGASPEDMLKKKGQGNTKTKPNKS